MPTPFNPDGRYDGSYAGTFETLIIQGNTVTVHLINNEFLIPEDLATQVADTAAHFDLATIEVENALFENKLPGRVDTSRPAQDTFYLQARVRYAAQQLLPAPASSSL